MASKAHADDPVIEQHDHAHHEPHVISIPVLIGTFAALIALTILTVGATAIDLGGAGNLVVALVVAAIKAILVALIFMHLWFDQKYNAMVFGGSLIFVFLFVAFTTIDASRYQDDIRAIDDEKAQQEVVAEKPPPATTATAAPTAPRDESVRLPSDDRPRTAPTAH
jgi:cytochrome c oxidase subunit IV